MKDSHLTLRLPAGLVRELTRRARDLGAARSQLVREAVTAYLAGPTAALPLREVTAASLAERWTALPHLEAAEAASFVDDLEAARATLPPSVVPPAWG